MSESERAPKRKRSLQDSADALIHSNTTTLAEETDNAKEDDLPAPAISTDNAAGGTLPKNATKPRQVAFSAVTQKDLEDLGITRMRLAFDPAVLENLVNDFKPPEEVIMADLYFRVKKIYERINTNSATGSRMILEAILFAAAEISSEENVKTNVVIVPEMRIPPTSITNPDTGYELCLSGSVNYVIVKFEDEWDIRERLLGPNVSSEDIADISRNRFFVTEVKCPDRSLTSYIPEAVSQSMAWMRFVGCTVANFCVTNGKEWMFFKSMILDGRDMEYFEPTIRRLSREELHHSDKPLREIMQLVLEWMREVPKIENLVEFGV